MKMVYQNLFINDDLMTIVVKRDKKQENYLHSFTIKCGQQNDVHL